MSEHETNLWRARATAQQDIADKLRTSNERLQAGLTMSTSTGEALVGAIGALRDHLVQNDLSLSANEFDGIEALARTLLPVTP